MPQVIHSTDIGDSLKIVTGKLEVDAVEIIKGIADANAAADYFMDSYMQANPADRYTPYQEIQGGVLAPAMPTYEELAAKVAAAKISHPDATRIGVMYGSSHWAYVKTEDGAWQISTNYPLGGVVGCLSPYCKVFNDSASPLFVNHLGEPHDLSCDVNAYNLRRNTYMRVVEGASATWELDQPQLLRSLELVTDTVDIQYLQGSLALEITYADGTTTLSRSYPYNNNWYMGDQIDQSKRVKQVKLTCDAKTLAECGKFPTLFSRDFTTGKMYHNTHPSYSVYTPVLSTNYIYGYCPNVAYPRFYGADEAQLDITSEFTASASIAALAGTSAANLVDGLGTTYYQSSTTANSVALTFIKPAETSPRNIKFVDVKLTPIAGSTAVFESLSRVVVTTGLNYGTSSSTSNTRDISGLALATSTLDSDGNYVMRFFAGYANVCPDPMDKLTITLTKTVAGNFKIAGVTIWGESPQA